MASRQDLRLIGTAALLALALVVASGPWSALAQEDGEPLLRLHTGAFDPLVDAPLALVDQRASGGGTRAARDGEAVFIVQFRSAPLPADQEALKALGGKVQAALQDHALIVRMSSDAGAGAARLARVRWVGPFLADYRLEEALLRRLTGDQPLNQQAGQGAGPQRYTILLFENRQDAKDRVSSEIRAHGGTVNLIGEGRLIEATLNDDALREVAGLNEVLFVERWTEAEDDMDLVRSLSGANFVETVEGYSGEGVRGEVFDDGVRAGHRDFQGNPPLFHPSNSSDNDHGTNTYGIVFGDGTANARGRGLLPDAEQPIFSTNNRSFDRYDHTAELVDPAGPYRAVFQSNSWGNSRTRAYTAISADMDDIIFDHDILITQSQSNAGNQDSRPQAWAKNIVSVGGIRHFNTATRNDDRWIGSASIGPASDGRIKPDLTHFYDGIFSTNETGNSAYAQFGGTSGATPAVAGAFGLLFQMWADGVFAGGPGLARDVFDTRPHASTAKALMINGAFQYAFSGTGHDRTRVHQGWGFPDLTNLYDAAEANGWSLPILIDESEVIGPGGTHEYQLTSAGDEPLKATLVYLDPPGIPNSSVHRVNDLSLKATSPGGTVYWGNNGLAANNWSSPGGGANTVDTVENVFIESPESGLWTIEVLASEIVQDAHVETAAIDADYALVVTGGDANVLPQVTVIANDGTATEAGPTSGSFRISRDGDTSSGLTVHYKVGGTATSGSDFASLGKSVRIAAGRNSAVVKVDPVDDSLAESNETVDLTLKADAAYEIGAPSEATVTIKSNDGTPARPTVTISKLRDPARERGRVKAKVRITRTGATSSALKVHYRINGTATPGRDYRALGRSTVIPAGKRSVKVTIRPIDDTLVEPDETVVVKLAQRQTYKRGASKRAKITIKSDDRQQAASVGP